MIPSARQQKDAAGAVERRGIGDRLGRENGAAVRTRLDCHVRAQAGARIGAPVSGSDRGRALNRGLVGVSESVCARQRHRMFGRAGRRIHTVDLKSGGAMPGSKGGGATAKAFALRSREYP